MHKYQKTTRYHSGAVRVTMDQDITTITRLSGNHPTKSVICTNAQGREVAHFILEGLGKHKGVDTIEANIVSVPQNMPFHIYKVSPGWSTGSIHLMAQGLLEIAAYVEANRTQLEKEAQEDSNLAEKSSSSEGE